MSALYERTSQGCFSLRGRRALWSTRLRPSLTAALDAPPRPFWGRVLLGQAGWRSLDVAPEETPSLPTDPQDLQSEPFWRVNKYFTHH